MMVGANAMLQTFSRVTGHIYVKVIRIETIARVHTRGRETNAENLAVWAEKAHLRCNTRKSIDGTNEKNSTC